MEPNNSKASLPFYDIKVVTIISLVNDMLVSFDYPFKHGIKNLRKLFLRYTQREQMALTFTEKTRWSTGHAHALTPSPVPNRNKHPTKLYLFQFVCLYTFDHHHHLNRNLRALRNEFFALFGFRPPLTDGTSAKPLLFCFWFFLTGS